jgi:hypothetical protein
MSRCLGDRTLWRLSEGEASREERAHVAYCGVCAARLRRLEQELGYLRLVLSGSPPSQGVPAQRPHVRMRWVVPVATLAAMVMLVWFGGWWLQPSSPLPVDVRQASIWPFIEGVSTALFPIVEIGFSAAPDRLSDLDDLQAALAWEWSCEEPEALANLACDDDTFALLLGEL